MTTWVAYGADSYQAAPWPGHTEHELGTSYRGVIDGLGRRTTWKYGLGIISPTDTVSTPAFDGLAYVKEVDANGFHTLVDSTYGIFAAGDNNHGQLGDGTETDRDSFIQVAGLPGSPPTNVAISPYVVHVSPADGATKVPPGTAVAASFTRHMDPASVTAPGTVTLQQQGATTPVGAKVSFNAKANQVTLKPDRPLTKGSTYTAAVSAAATDTAGTPLDQDPMTDGNQPEVWAFTVGR